MRSETGRRSAKLVLCAVVSSAALLLASPAAGSAKGPGAIVPFSIHGEYQLEYGFAKRAISHETAALCNSTEGCVNWSVSPCRRQSWHRIDCVSHLYGENGVTCGFVSIAVWPPWSNHVLLHHKRVFCTPPS
jgi:hypothetical protein